jgi:hypothetical protein
MPFASLLKSLAFVLCHAIISNTVSVMQLSTNLRHLYSLNRVLSLMGCGTLIVPWYLNAAAVSRLPWNVDFRLWKLWQQLVQMSPELLKPRFCCWTSLFFPLNPLAHKTHGRIVTLSLCINVVSTHLSVKRAEHKYNYFSIREGP